MNEDGIEVRVQDESVWLTQEGISQLYDKGRTTITEHLKHIFSEIPTYWFGRENL